jgi:hypothetical protein
MTLDGTESTPVVPPSRHRRAMALRMGASGGIDCDVSDVSRKGFHAFRHLNVSLMDRLRVPLKTIKERIGHAFIGSFTLDV